MKRRARASQATAKANSSAAQRSRLLRTLSMHTVTTIEARRYLDILAPAARVHELRKEGVNVVTFWDKQQTVRGRFHRVALYMLFSKGTTR